MFGIPLGAPAAGLLLLVCVALGWLAHREASALAPPRRRALLGVRAISLTLLFLVCSRPGCAAEHHETIDGRLRVLFDTSRSVDLALGEPARSAQARAVVTSFLEQPDASRARFSRFGAELAETTLTELSDAYPVDEERTRLVESLRRAAADDAELELGAIVVVSDGADTDFEELPPDFQLDGVRVHAVALGVDEDVRDDAIRGLSVDPVGYLRQPLRVRVRVATTLDEPRRLPLRLFHGDELVREQVVSVPASGEVSVSLTLTPQHLGRALYRVSIPVDVDDAVPANNQRSFLVNVRRDKLRVLLVTGQPSWDVRFLRVFLKRDPAIDLISFFILRTANDLTMAPSEELALIPFPTDELFSEHLGSFDVIIFQNFDYAPYEMGAYLPRIRDYVLRGGAFAMIGGDRAFGPGGYAGTPIETILPVGVPPESLPVSRSLVEGRFQPRVVTANRHHPLVALLPDERESLRLWEGLSPLEGANQVTRVSALGRVLLEHPREHALSGGALPVLAVGRAGEGRVLALMADTSWRWGMSTAGASGDASAYDRFWDRALRWLTKDPTLDPARVATDQERYAAHGRVRVHGEARDEVHEPYASRELSLAIVPADGDVPVVTRAVTTDAGGAFTAELTAPERPGGYRVVVGAPAAPGSTGAASTQDAATGSASTTPGPAALASEWFVVEEGGDELADPRPRPALLRALAERTGGRFVSATALPQLSDFDTRRTRSLGIATRYPFESWPALLTLAGALILEWSLRRRWGKR
ncbi:MAG: glutamine amidotransferase [Polyangiales bacterium]